MKPYASETWPPPPMRPEPQAEISADSDDWLTANDVIREVTWRDYAIVYSAVLWLLLACFALAFHHHLPAGATRSVPHIIQTFAL